MATDSLRALDEAALLVRFLHRIDTPLRIGRGEMTRAEDRVVTLDESAARARPRCGVERRPIPGPGFPALGLGSIITIMRIEARSPPARAANRVAKKRPDIRG